MFSVCYNMKRGPVLLCCVVMQALLSEASVFLHQPSHIVVTPPGVVTNDTDFGFSIAYQNGAIPNLVIGSPHGDMNGEVFGCPIEDVLSKKTPCTKFDINVQNLTKERDGWTSLYFGQNLCLGASIAATPDYFLTCAPLWTSLIERYSKDRKGKNLLAQAAVGTCFVHSGTSTRRYYGTWEQNRFNNEKFTNTNGMIGGLGWTTLVDQTNDLLVISKSSIYGDILQVKASSPLSRTQSLIVGDYNDETITNNMNYLRKFNNLGYGLASGNFFSDSVNTIYYAFSMQDIQKVGVIHFLEYNAKSNSLTIKMYRSTQSIGYQQVVISAEVEGSMFGAAMWGADVDADGVAELLVGAPGYSDDVAAADAGALYIYLGGDMEAVDSAARKRVVFANKDGSRFGAAIATSDIDGDGLPEIFVTAPYEDFGMGALYVLSGLEVNEVLIKSSKRELYLSALQLTQRVRVGDFKSFGYSLQVVPDVDQNGCDELAVGSPGSASVVLFRCVPAINATVSTQLIQKIVAEYDSEFTVQVCVDVRYRLKSLRNMPVTNVSVISTVEGKGVEINNSRFDINLSRKEEKYCYDVIVQFKFKESGFYNFTAKLESNIDFLLQKKEFDSAWVTLSAYSKTEDTVYVTRRCSELDCTPDLEMSLKWSGPNDTRAYVLGSSGTEEVTVEVRNKGGSTYDGCVRVRLSGAEVNSTGCGTDPDDRSVYKCYLRQPLIRNATYPIHIVLNMNKSTNMDDRLYVQANLSSNCNNKNVTPTEMEIQYYLNFDDIILHGSSINNRNITDTEILNANSTTTIDQQVYKIKNKGSIKWKNIGVSVFLDNNLKSTFIETYKVTTAPQGYECLEGLNGGFHCIVELKPNETLKIFVISTILKQKIQENLDQEGRILIPSNISVTLTPSKHTLEDGLTTMIYFHKELSMENNKTLIIVIAVIVAILVLAVLVSVLYKFGFFKRKTKTRLDSFKASVRRQSVKQATAGKEATPGSEDDDDIDIEVVEEPPFEHDQVCPASTADEVTLIVPDTTQHKAQVHST